MNYTFLYNMKKALARLKMIMIIVHITEFCDQYGVNPDETWMYGDWFYSTNYTIFGHEVKVTERSPADNLTQWIIAKSKGFTRKGIGKISRYVMALFVWSLFVKSRQGQL